MSISGAIYARAQAHSGLSDLISGRCYPVKMPDNVTLPAVTFQVISAPRTSVFGEDTGDVRARLQFDVWAENFGADNQALEIADQLRAAFQRYTGTLDGTLINDIMIQSERHEWDDKALLYRLSFDFIIWYEES